MARWRQGDFVLGVGGFVHIGLPELGSDEPFSPVLDEGVAGLVVVSQTCDIVNFTQDRSFVTVCPLVEIPMAQLPYVASGRTPTYTVVKNVPKETLVADLSRMMTVSKELLVQWDRNSGFDTDEERHRFAFALERKHGRFAYPDALVETLGRFRSRAISKHAKGSELGKIYRSIREIRIRAAPHWQAERVEIAFVVIVEDEDDREIGLEAIKKEINEQVRGLALPDRFELAHPPFILGTRDDLVARDVTDSVPLDLAFLSLHGKAP